jgi:CheY-like chemotaxis protein
MVCSKDELNQQKIMKVLVAHRQRKTVDLIKSVLSGSNPVVFHAESGLDGLLTSRIEHFDVIICGTDLPVVTGFEMVRSIRTNSINRKTPVLFVTGELDEKTIHLGNALGARVLLSGDLMCDLAGVVSEHVTAAPDRQWYSSVSYPKRTLH